MRLVGIHLSYWTRQWSDDVLPLIRKARESGFDIAELPLISPSTMDFTALKKEADQQGIRLSCCTGLPPDCDISHPDPAVQQRGIDHIIRCLEGAAVVGSPVLAGVLHVGWGAKVPEGDFRPYMERSVEVIRRVAEEAKCSEVTLCLEVLNRYEAYFLNNVQDSLDFLERVGHPNVKLLLDTYHMNIEEDDVAEAVRRAGESLGHLHCAANNRKRPGRGHISWEDLRNALDEIDYQRWIVMECFPYSESEVGRGMFAWHSFTDDVDADAREGATFLKERFS